MEQVQKQRKFRRQEPVDTDELEPEVSESAKEEAEKTDKLLDEIDALMEQDPITVLKQTLKDKKGNDLTLADLMREGASVTGQAIGAFERDGDTCALSAAMLAAKARGLV